MAKSNYQLFHKAARDGSLDLLRETTRTDCNRVDEDGLTPTLWAAFYGNLDALRLLVGRGGNPDKCDFFGSTALHLATTNGHMNCVTFLVSFGCSLWALDNNLHTALEVAGLNNRAEVVRFLDFICDKQSILNTRLVKKWKEKAILDAQKRIKKLNKMESKAQKKAEKEDLKLRNLHKKMQHGTANSVPVSVSSNIKRKMSCVSMRTIISEPKPYSAHFTLTSQHKKFVMGGVVKKIKQKQSSKTEIDGEFKIREIESNGKKTVRSLSGMKRDSHIMYIRNKISDNCSLTDSSQSANEFYMRSKSSDIISRAVSEPEFINQNSCVEMHDSAEVVDRNSMFERPGFGSVSFINRKIASGTLMSYPSDVNHSHHDIPLDNYRLLSVNIKGIEKTSTRYIGNYDTSSIGTLGSLAVRMKTLPWGEDIIDDDYYFLENSTLEFFLASNNLSEYYVFFTNEDIDMQAMLLLTEGDLNELGLPMGPRRKLLEAISKRQSELAKPSHLADSVL